MNVLVLNGGSSSIKFSVFDVDMEDDPRLLLDGELSGIQQPQATLTFSPSKAPQQVRRISHVDRPERAINAILDLVTTESGVAAAEAVGYRVVHPGSRTHDHTLITEEVLKELETAAAFAPLHDPEAVAMIRETMRHMPNVPHVACFDTVFHESMPEEASTYAIPRELRDRGVKRYGFHGLSCESVVRQLHRVGPLPERLVIAHLGSGCSVTAVRNGLSIDTTMGLTPTGGVVMGTRPGDLDPGLMLYILRQERTEDAAGAVEHMLNHQAGMVALTGLPNDMEVVRKTAAEGNEPALLALRIFTRSVRKAIGGFAWLMGGLDAIVFTGGIGQHDAATRAEVLAGTEAHVNSSLNKSSTTVVTRIDASDSATAIYTVPAQEDLVIALHVRRMVLADIA
jgi:acetate kinase